MSDFKEFYLPLFGMVAGLVAAAFAFAIWLGPMECDAKFGESKMEWRWSLLGGCQVMDRQQGWVPSDNYRVL